MAAPKKLSAGQIINQLRKAEVGLANGKRVKQVCRGGPQASVGRCRQPADAERSVRCAWPTGEPALRQRSRVHSPSGSAVAWRVGCEDAVHRCPAGSPWENGYNESFNGTLRQELLGREIFYSLQKAKVLIGQWRREYNTVRPHSSLGYLPPAPEAIRPDPKLLNLPLLLGPHPRQNEAVRLTL